MSNLCFFLFVPLLLRSLGRSLPNLVERLRAAPDISSRGSFIKGQGHRGQRPNFCISQSLGRISPNLVGWWRAAPDIGLRGSFFKRSRSSRSKVKFMFLSVCSPTSQVLGPIFTKLGGKVEGGPGVHLLKVKVIKVKCQISVSPRSLGRISPNLEGCRILA